MLCYRAPMLCYRVLMLCYRAPMLCYRAPMLCYRAPMLCYRALLLLTVAVAGLSLSACQNTYVSSPSLIHQPIGSLLGRSDNPRLGFSFVEAQLSRQVLNQLLVSPYPQLSSGLLQRLVKDQSTLPAVGQLQTLLEGPYRQLVQPIYRGLLPYYLYNRGG